jgi:hypothetical protein
MVLSVKQSVLLCTAVLLWGAATQAVAQEAEDDLRLDTDIPEEQVAPPPPPPDFAKIQFEDEEPVRRRKRPDVDPYAPPGLRVGSFKMFPTLEIGADLTTNVNRSATKPKHDAILSLKPTLRFESDWSRHGLSATFSADAVKFMNSDDVDTLSGSAAIASRVDIRRTTRADFETGYSINSVELGDSELPASAVGTRRDTTVSSNSSITHDFGGLEGRLRLGLTRNIYGDVDLVGGGTEDNSDRNYLQTDISARLALRTGAAISPFAEVAYAPRFHDKKTDRNGLKRNSQGLRLTAGASIADDPIWQGDIAATLEMRDYSDDSLGHVVLPGIAANLTWRPTDLTRFEFNTGASLAETVSANTSSSKRWTVGLTASHALRDNVELVAGLKGDIEHGADTTDLTTTASLGVNWTLNPYVVLNAGYEGTFFNTEGSNGDYTDHRLLTSIILRH